MAQFSVYVTREQERQLNQAAALLQQSRSIIVRTAISLLFHGRTPQELLCLVQQEQLTSLVICSSDNNNDAGLAPVQFSSSLAIHRELQGAGDE